MSATRFLVMRAQHPIIVEERHTLPCGGRFNCEDFHRKLGSLPQLLCVDRLVMMQLVECDLDRPLPMAVDERNLERT